MDLQAGQQMSTKRQALTTLATLFCFALACAFMIGSLMMPEKQHSGQSGTPLSANFATRLS